MDDLGERVQKLENDRKITGTILGLLIVAVLALLWKVFF